MLFGCCADGDGVLAQRIAWRTMLSRSQRCRPNLQVEEPEMKFEENSAATASDDGDHFPGGDGD